MREWLRAALLSASGIGEMRGTLLNHPQLFRAPWLGALGVHGSSEGGIALVVKPARNYIANTLASVT